MIPDGTEFGGSVGGGELGLSLCRHLELDPMALMLGWGWEGTVPEEIICGNDSSRASSDSNMAALCWLFLISENVVWHILSGFCSYFMVEG